MAAWLVNADVLVGRNCHVDLHVEHNLAPRAAPELAAWTLAVVLIVWFGWVSPKQPT